MSANTRSLSTYDDESGIWETFLTEKLGTACDGREPSGQGHDAYNDTGPVDTLLGPLLRVTIRGGTHLLGEGGNDLIDTHAEERLFHAFSHGGFTHIRHHFLHVRGTLKKSTYQFARRTLRHHLGNLVIFVSGDFTAEGALDIKSIIKKDEENPLSPMSINGPPTLIFIYGPHQIIPDRMDAIEGIKLYRYTENDAEGNADRIHHILPAQVPIHYIHNKTPEPNAPPFPKAGCVHAATFIHQFHTHPVVTRHGLLEHPNRRAERPWLGGGFARDFHFGQLHIPIVFAQVMLSAATSWMVGQVPSRCTECFQSAKTVGCKGTWPCCGKGMDNAGCFESTQCFRCNETTLITPLD